jgi:hypothetical protein
MLFKISLSEGFGNGVLQSRWVQTFQAVHTEFNNFEGAVLNFLTKEVKKGGSCILNFERTATCGLYMAMIQTKKDGSLYAQYEYDSNGNRLTKTTPTQTISGTYDGQDRLLTYGNYTYTYSVNGELESKIGVQVLNLEFCY